MDDVYMDQMDLKTLYRFSWTCKKLNDRVSGYMRRAFRPKNLFAPIFKPNEHLLFRLLQFKTGLVISEFQICWENPVWKTDGRMLMCMAAQVGTYFP
uniref:F-box domain-containing protein n=1 Tax=Psilocybe cubensis TaxID=181762 RepID=A0A8H7XQJ3_PSICU